MLLDTWHSYKQLAAEMARLPAFVRHHIALHDTTTFEFRDEGLEGHGPNLVCGGCSCVLFFHV